MATPMFRDLSRALEAPEEGRELWSGVPADEEPAYAEEMFRKASDAALARENALPKIGYVPAGVGPVVEPSVDSTLAPMPSGIRSRKPIDFTPDTTKLQGRLAGFLGGNQPLQGPGYARPLSDEEFASEQARARKLMAADIAAPIPFASASPRADVPEATKGAIAPTTPADGAGGDDEMGRLSMGQALVRALEGSGSIIAGQNLRSGAADTLGERMKQIEALRAKREERSMELAREDEQSAALVSQYKSLAAQGLVPELPGLDKLPFKQAASLIKTYGSLPGLVQRAEKTKAEIPLVQARAGTEEQKPEQKDTQLKETERHNRAMENAAFLSATRAARGAAEDRGVRPEALTNRLKDLNAQTKPFQEIVSSLQEADAALSALGTGQISRGAKIASKIPLVGESLVSTPELRAMQGQEGLKQSYQKLKTGLAAVGQELASFERQFGTDWQADPRKAPMAIETLKQITRDALRRTQAPFGAGTGNAVIDQMEVLSLLKNTGGLTADNLIFQPNPKLAAAAGMTPPPASLVRAEAGGAPTPTPAGATVRIQRKAGGPIRSVPAADKARYLANPDFVEVP
jgi:hypothetical protein